MRAPYRRTTLRLGRHPGGEDCMVWAVEARAWLTADMDATTTDRAGAGVWSTDDAIRMCFQEAIGRDDPPFLPVRVVDLAAIRALTQEREATA